MTSPFLGLRRTALWVVTAAALFLVSRAGAVVYVNANATGLNSGNDWANAYTTISAAVADPRSATEHIWIVATEYTERLNIPSGRTLLCGFTGDETEEGQRQPGSNRTVLNGSGLPGTGSMVIVQNANAVFIDGLEIIGGEATGSGDERSGGGIRASGSGTVLTLVRCLIHNNTAVDGGGVGALGGASVRFENCQVSDNDSLDDGGAIYATGQSTVSVLSCPIQDNRAADSGGGLYASVGSTVTIDGCDFRGNVSGEADTGQGGAVYLREGVVGTIRNCDILYSLSGMRGGGVGVERSTLSLRDSRLGFNNVGAGGMDTENYRGAGLFALQSTLDFDHVIFQENLFHGPARGGGMALVDCPEATLKEILLFYNSAEFGGGFYCENSALVFDRLACIGNLGFNSGAVGLARNNSTITCINGFLTSNQGMASFDVGGASHLTLNSCTLTVNDNPLLLYDTSTAEVRNTIFHRNQGTAIEESTTDADATILNCLFQDNSTADVFDEGIADFTGAAAINTFVNGAVGVVEGEPSYQTDSVTNPQYNFSSSQTSPFPGVLVLTGVSPALTAGELADRFVVLGEGAARVYLARENTADTVSLYFSGARPLPGTFRLLDPAAAIDSTAVDAGTADQAPSIDFLGRPRPVDLPGFGDAGGLTFDIGAGETPADRIIPAVFVREQPDSVQNGLTWDHAYGSIQMAINDPRSQSLPIFVQEGAYNEILVMQSDRRIYGGLALGDTQTDNYSGSSVVDASGMAAPNHVIAMVNVQNTLLSRMEFISGNASGAADTPEGHGGGLYGSNVDDTNRIEICRFRNNAARGNGGGMALEASKPVIESCVFDNNSALNGGGFSISGGGPAMTHCFPRNNTATGQGGGLFVDAGATPSFNAGNLNDNHAARGGNMAVVGSAVLGLYNSYVFLGSASQQGGGLYVGDAYVTVNEGAIGNNTAALAGGGVYLDDGAGFTITQCQINVNRVTSAGDGGGMAVGQGANVSVHNCLFRANTIGDGRGAGLYLDSNSITNIFRNTFIANVTGPRGLGGGLYSESTLNSAPIAQCIFLRNTAWIGGGAYLNRANHSLSQCAFVGNRAVGGDGGGVYFNGIFQRNLEDCLLYRNVADDDGGGMYVLRGAPGIINCTFDGNQCADNGGGLLIDGAAPVVLNNVFAANTPSGIYEQSTASDPAQLAFNFFDTPGTFYVDEGISNLASAAAINNLANANDNRSGTYNTVENVHYLAGKVTSLGTGSSDTGYFSLYLQFDNGLSVEPGQFIGPIYPEPGELAGRFLSVDSQPNVLYRIYDNDETRVMMRDVPVGNLQLGQNFRIHDFVPLPTTGTVDTGSDQTPSMADLRGVSRPYPVYPSRGTGFDIGAYEVVQSDLIRWIKDVVLGKVTSLDPAIGAVLDANGDGHLDVADIVALLARLPPA